MFHVNGTKHPFKFVIRSPLLISALGVESIWKPTYLNGFFWLLSKMWKRVLWYFSIPTKGSPQNCFNYPWKCRHFWWSCLCLLEMFHVNGTKHPFKFVIRSPLLISALGVESIWKPAYLNWFFDYFLKCENEFYDNFRAQRKVPQTSA